MAILGFATEMIHYEWSGSGDVQVGTSGVRTTIHIGGNGTSVATKKLAAPLSDFWIAMHFAAQFASAPCFTLRGSNGVDFLRFDPNGWSWYAGTMDVAIWDGAAWVVIGSFSMDGTSRFDIRVQMLAAGVLKIYKDAALVLDYAGDLTLGATDCGSLYFNRPGSGGDPGITFSGVIIADEDTRLLESQSLSVAGVGTFAEWTGDHTAIDEVGLPADSDFAWTTVAGSRLSFALENVDASFATAHSVVGVGISARAARAGESHLVQAGVVSGAVEGYGASFTPPGSFSGYAGAADAFFATDPATGAAWTLSAVDALEGAIKAVAAV